jgi:hypothetical protein
MYLDSSGAVCGDGRLHFLKEVGDNDSGLF